MRQPDAQWIAAAWIERWSHDPPSPPRGEEADLDHVLPRTHPRVCLDAIVQVLSRISADPSHSHFRALAAGPLEDLLSFHGAAYVEEIELLARRESKFRLLLNGVWHGRFAPAVSARLEKYCNDPW
jgi:hypothetical protein